VGEVGDEAGKDGESEGEGGHEIAPEAEPSDLSGQERYEQDGEEYDADDGDLLIVVSGCPGRDCVSVGEVGDEAGEEGKSEGEGAEEEDGVVARVVEELVEFIVVVVILLVAPAEDGEGEQGRGEE
jgi:hypothetical protein